MIFCSVIATALVLATAQASAAAQSGRVQGVVLDQQNRAVPGASVTVTGTAFSAAATTDASGRFAIDVPSAGRYDVRAELSGLGVDTRAAILPPAGAIDVTLMLRPAYIETVVVTASRFAQTLSSVPATVTVIPGREVGVRAGDDFADLFAGTAGLNMTRLNARDLSFDFRTAGGILSRSQLVMVDGRSLNQEGLGIVLWDLVPVTFDDIAQVELIGTPGSAVWGANALTGVVNIRTKAPKDDLGGRATIALGSVGVRQGRLHWAQQIGRLSYRASGSYFTEDAWERDPLLPDGSPMPTTAMFPNQGTTQTRLDVRADWEGAPGHVWTAHTGIADSSGIVHTSTGPNALADQGSYAVYSGVAFRSDPVEAQVYWNRTRGDTVSVLFGDDFSSTVNTIVGDVIAHRALGARQAVSVGGSVTLNTFDLTLAPGDSFRSAVGAFIEDQVALTPRLTWTIGTRVDKFDTFAATLSPRTSLVFRPTRKQALRVAVNRAYRAPSLIETFASTTIDNVIPIVPGLPPVVFSTLVTGNRRLDPEVGRAVEVGITSEVGARATVSASAYYNSTNGFVRFYETESYGPNAPPPGWPLPVELVPAVPRTLTWLNAGRVRNRGIELTGRVELPYGLSTRASYTFQDAPKATGTDPRYPLQLNRQPKQMASAGLIYQSEEWNGSVDTSYVGEAYWSDVLDARFWGTTPSFVLLNARVAYPLPRVSMQLALSGTNLLDRRIKQHVFGDILRRHVSAELQVRW